MKANRNTTFSDVSASWPYFIIAIPFFAFALINGDSEFVVFGTVMQV